MNQYFSKKRLVKLCFLGICISFFSFNNTPNKEENDFNEVIKNAEAYYLFSQLNVIYKRTWTLYKRDIEVKSKLVVNNIAGVDKFAFLNLTENQSNNLKRISVKTLKADGSIIELDSSLVFSSDKKNIDFGVISYPIPGVEPGDTIETSYVFTENVEKQELSDYAHLHNEIPNLNSEYNVKTETDLWIRYKTYNGFPEPEVVSKDSSLHVRFALKNIDGLKINEYSCVPCELPYFYYAMEEKENHMRSWKDVYNEEFNAITQPLALDLQNKSYYKRWKKRVIGTAKDSSKYYQFKLLHQEVVDKFTMQPIQIMEMAKPTGYFLKEEKFDELSIRRFYRQVLEDLEIPYWAVFGKSKRNGVIDPHYIRIGEYDHNFFAYENANGSLSFVYPHDEIFMYLIDEIPTTLYQTEVILVKPYESESNKKKRKSDKFIGRDLQMAKVDSVLATLVKIPGISRPNNYSNQMVFAKVDPTSKSTSLRYRYSLSGGISTDVRNFFQMMSQDEEMSEYYDTYYELDEDGDWMEVDSIKNIHVNNKKPFLFTVSGSGSLKEVVSFVNDSLVSISIDKIIEPAQIESINETAELDYYIDYAYSDYFTFVLNFPNDIEVLGIGDGVNDYKNEFGAYYLEIKQSNSKELSIKSNYKILEDFIPKDKYSKLKELNNLVSEIKNKKIIVKLKKLNKEPVLKP